MVNTPNILESGVFIVGSGRVLANCREEEDEKETRTTWDEPSMCEQGFDPPFLAFDIFDQNT